LLLFHLKQRTCSPENKDATRVLLNSSENKDATQVLFIVSLLRNPVKGKIKMLCTTAVCVIPNSGDIIRQQQLIKNRDCHPVCNTPFDASISDSENKGIKEIARDAVSAFKRAIVAGNWKSPEGILGEQCWKRPVDYLVTEEL
jgi:hypothetical protein